MVVEDAVMGLQLCGKELVVHYFDVADAGEGYLLLNGVGEPFATYGVDEGHRNVVADEDAAIEHGLQCEASGEGDVDAEVCAEVVDADVVVHADEVVGAVVVGGMEACATRGEVPLVFVVQVGGDVVGEVVVVSEVGGVAVGGEQLAIVVEVVPSEACVDEVVAEAQVKWSDLSGVLVVADVVGALAIGVEVEVVVTEGVGEGGGKSDALGDEGVFGTCHEAAPESEGAGDSHRQSGVDGQFGVDLQCSHLLGVEAEADAGDGRGG